MLIRILLTLLFFMPLSMSEGAPVVVQPTEQLPQVVLRENFIQQAEKCIKEALLEAGETRRYTIESVIVPAGLRLPLGEITYAGSIPNGIRFARGTQVNLDVLVNGKKYSTVRCSMRIRVYDNMVVATRQLRQEQVITAADVRLEEREDTGANWKYFTDVNQVVGLVPVKGIGQGKILNSNIIQYPICILHGTKVNIKAEVNGIMVTAEGVAMENGRKNRYINVKNTTSGRILRAKVIDENNVEVAA
ncbi:MAG: flagellar basal body P-ring formation chaperone FlgA [Anaerovibrio sp.]|uniref:flagellar basal body P-ring formation chaperone FlgA n=1 Tax=Anaerovibrio sp. TaxID=1872532 RepID=UPI0025EA4AE7|nr:flagellar basal body P-ring formation chaperone FlgA [Anaerovibrio sp.]MCR5176210.1 flagellar basal body P-ring formation chaperone FlgA [Anaerovibrio sp.]